MSDQHRTGSWLARHGIDWVDIAGMVALAMVGVGATITWSVGIGLIVAGALLFGVVVALTFRRPEPPPTTRRT